MAITAPDLKKRPPRSPRVRLGGLVILPRMLDKGRATLAATNGDYNFGCPMDRRLLDFIGIEPQAVLEQLRAGQGDAAVLHFVLESGRNRRQPWEISVWSSIEENRAPSELEARAFFNEEHHRIAPSRTDIQSWFDLLDLDDYVSFGGTP